MNQRIVNEWIKKKLQRCEDRGAICEGTLTAGVQCDRSESFQ
jgi:hypothetical protein